MPEAADLEHPPDSPGTAAACVGLVQSSRPASAVSLPRVVIGDRFYNTQMSRRAELSPR